MKDKTLKKTKRKSSKRKSSKRKYTKNKINKKKNNKKIGGTLSNKKRNKPEAIAPPIRESKRHKNPYNPEYPRWAQGEELEQSLIEQESVEPEDIFGAPNTAIQPVYSDDEFEEVFLEPEQEQEEVPMETQNIQLVTNPINDLWMRFYNWFRGLTGSDTIVVRDRLENV
tara:strand:- start:40 stop:546 length:507 start_codon:yes stop_codon:yes gene_type:complete